MAQNIRDVMTSNPCTIDAEKSVAYAAKMMREEDVGLAPIVEGDKLIGMLTDRDIATRVAAEGRDPDQVKVRDVASKQLVTIDPGQDLDEALRMMAKHQVRRLPVVEEDGRLVGVVAQADIAREGDDTKTGRLVEEISEPGGQMSSFEEGQVPTPQFPTQVEAPEEVPEGPQQVEQRDEEGVSKVQAASSRGRRRKRATTARKTTARKTTARKKTTGARKRKTTARKKTTTARKRSTGRKTVRAAGRKGGRATARKRAATTRKRKTTARKKTTGARKRKTTARKKTTTARKRSTTARKRKTTARKRTTGTRKKTTTARKRSTGRKTVRAAGRKGGRATARKRRTTRK